MTHVAIARQTWSAIAGCEHRFAGAAEDATLGPGAMNPPEAPGGVVVGPDLTDICKQCGATREHAALVQRFLRYLGRTVPWGGPR